MTALIDEQMLSVTSARRHSGKRKTIKSILSSLLISLLLRSCNHDRKVYFTQSHRLLRSLRRSAPALLLIAFQLNAHLVCVRELYYYYSHQLRTTQRIFGMYFISPTVILTVSLLFPVHFFR